MARAQERIRHMALINQPPLRLPPGITYGRKRNKNKLIPLTGIHLARPDPYDIPLDEDNEPQTVPRRVVIGKVYSAKEPNPDDFSLSEDELEAVYGREAGPLSSPPGLSPAIYETSAAELSLSSDSPPRRRRIPQPMPRIKRVNETSTEPSSTASDVVIERSLSRERVIPRTTPPTSHVVNKKGIAKPTYRDRSAVSLTSKTSTASSSDKQPKTGSINVQVSKTASRNNSRPALRQLPVNELILVRSPTQPPHVSTTCNTSSPYDGEQHDPIDPSSTASKRRASAISEDEIHKAPLTSIRKRLKKPKFTHKSVVALRKKHNARRPFFKADNHPRQGDGFESSELKITQPATVMKRRRACKPLTMGFSALTLQSGPLPEVEFHTSSLELKVNQSHDDDAFLADDEGAAPADSSLEADSTAPQPERRAVNLSDRVLDEMVAQRLSSVSAPKRVYSISSDDDEDDDDEEGDWNQSDEEVDAGSQDQGREIDSAQSTSHELPKHSNDHSHQASKQDSTILPPAQEHPRRAGVTLDFRKTISPGMTPKTPFHQRHLIEVNEMIDDEHDAEDWPAPAQINGHAIVQPAVNVTRFADQETPVKLHRPRSILRRNTSVVQDSHTRPEHTAVNTRRNSVRVIEGSAYFNTAPSDLSAKTNDDLSTQVWQREVGKQNNEIDLDESRYFSNAAGMLRDQAHSRPRIIKQRSSEARRASYFSQAEVLVPDTDAAVLETSTAIRETSLDPPDYTNFSKLDVLKRTSDATWTSSLPRVSRDLKTLTRTVSKEHGTLSQSARRRPSLPFHSPVKKIK